MPRGERDKEIERKRDKEEGNRVSYKAMSIRFDIFDNMNLTLSLSHSLSL